MISHTGSCDVVRRLKSNIDELSRAPDQALLELASDSLHANNDSGFINIPCRRYLAGQGEPEWW